jgi:hypothetical protein
MHAMRRIESENLNYFFFMGGKKYRLICLFSSLHVDWYALVAQAFRANGGGGEKAL